MPPDRSTGDETMTWCLPDLAKLVAGPRSLGH